jgi:hypothetical protein
MHTTEAVKNLKEKYLVAHLDMLQAQVLLDWLHDGLETSCRC